MPGLLHITLAVSPFSPPVARLVQDEGPAQTHLIRELVRPERHLVQELVRAQPHLVHDIGRPQIHETSRSQTKVESANSSQSNPPQSSDSQEVARPRSAVDKNLDVEEDMERMVHLTPPQDAEFYQGQPAFSDPETELGGGPGAADASLEASGFYGADAEDRDRGEEGEERERRGGEERGEDEWEKDRGEERERRGEGEGGEEGERGGGADDPGVPLRDDLEVNHTTPDLDALIGYSASFHSSSSRQPSLSSSPAQEHDPGLQQHRTPLFPEVAPLERELWEAEGEEEGQASGYGVVHSSITTTITTTTATTTTTSTTTTAAAAAGDTVGTATPETDTGTDFGLLGNYAKEDEEAEREEEEETELTHLGVFTQNPTVPEVGMAPSREPLQPSMEEEEGLEEGGEELEEEEEWREMEREETGARHIVPLGTDPSPTVGFTDVSWDWLEKTTPLQTKRSEVKGGGVTEFFLPDPTRSNLNSMQEAQQVVCVDWTELAGRGYVILNMTENMSCEEFQADQGVRFLEIMERVFARRMNSPEGSWELYLSKPTHQQHQLLMNVVSEHGVIEAKDVLGMLGEIRKSLTEMGIQNYSAASSCQPRPSQTRSDYGKLFVVLVIIGSVCMVIITSGLIYICWQRRLPATKTMSRAEELHFVENGCHDNPTLDVTNDNQPEMQEKKPSTNGLVGGGEGGGEESSRWQVFVNQPGSEEEEEEQDTHL
ncbi:podocalyxin-like protein 2 [Centroberyx affinis]|uniref:podocalyxin-like protein 2 n=1 Tax=Centroberyx affinis TaxID=166261 RepID=UPI003A5BF5B8